jgi:hypothetical protein
MFKKRDWGRGEAQIGLIWLRIGTRECGNELSGSIKCGEFVD